MTPATSRQTVRDALGALVKHPIRFLVYDWNWKQALFVAAIRGALFFSTNLSHGKSAAWRALLVDAAFRLPLAGVYPAVTQALRSAEPGWAVVATNLAVLPVAAHLIELSVHWTLGTA